MRRPVGLALSPSASLAATLAPVGPLALRLLLRLGLVLLLLTLSLLLLLVPVILLALLLSTGLLLVLLPAALAPKLTTTLNVTVRLVDTVVELRQAAIKAALKTLQEPVLTFDLTDDVTWNPDR